jgi:hypothetical protein
MVRGRGIGWVAWTTRSAIVDASSRTNVGLYSPSNAMPLRLHETTVRLLRPDALDAFFKEGE